MLWLTTLLLGALVSASWFLFQRFQNRFNSKDFKRLAIYSGTVVILFALSSLITLFAIRPETPVSPPVIFGVISLLFLIIGLGHVWLLIRYKYLEKEKKLTIPFLLSGFILFLGSFIFVAISLWRSIDDVYIENENTFDSSLVLFIIPLMVYITIDKIKKIPELKPRIWTFNPNYIPSTPVLQPGEESCEYIFEMLGQRLYVNFPKRYECGNALHWTIADEMNVNPNFIVNPRDEKGMIRITGWYLQRKTNQPGISKYIYADKSFVENRLLERDTIEVVEAG